MYVDHDSYCCVIIIRTETVSGYRSSSQCMGTAWKVYYSCATYVYVLGKVWHASK